MTITLAAAKLITLNHIDGIRQLILGNAPVQVHHSHSLNECTQSVLAVANRSLLFAAGVDLLPDVECRTA